MQTITKSRLFSALIGGLVFAPQLPALAEVNLKDASFSKTWTDLPQFKRTYNSRSLHQGLFGFGWCTDYEKKLSVQANEIQIDDCQNPQASHFFRTTTHGDNYFVSVQGESILKSQSRFIHTAKDKSVSIYNQNGQLIALRRNKNIELTYDDRGDLHKIDFAKKYVLRLHYDSLAHQKRRRIHFIEGPRQLSSHYFYESEQLVRNINAWKKEYHFTYDDLENLTEIKYPDKTSEKITYDRDKDWALSFKDRKNCQENYTYEQDPDQKNTGHQEPDQPDNTTPDQNKKSRTLHFLSKIERQCPRQARLTASIEFWHQTDNNTSYLSRARITRGQKITELQFESVAIPTADPLPTNSRKNSPSRRSLANSATTLGRAALLNTPEN